MSAWRITFQDHRFQAFGSGINRGGEAGWTSANDSEIAGNLSLILVHQSPEKPGDLCDFAQRRVSQRHSVRRYQRRQIATRQVQAFA